MLYAIPKLSRPSAISVKVRPSAESVHVAVSGAGSAARAVRSSVVAFTCRNVTMLLEFGTRVLAAVRLRRVRGARRARLRGQGAHEGRDIDYVRLGQLRDRAPHERGIGAVAPTIL